MKTVSIAFVIASLLVACGSTSIITGPASDSGAGDGALGADGGGNDSGNSSDAARGDSGLPPGACRATSDCTNTPAYCTAFTLPVLCNGQCDNAFSPQCQVDGDCTADGGANAICDARLCDCPHGGAQPQNHCRAGCGTDADCGPGLTCDATHRCAPASCAQPSECGTGNFTCASGHCAAKTCTTDGDCANYCVNGACYAGLGECLQPVP